MMPGSQIAHYRITSKLGEGGMGAVYLATGPPLHHLRAAEHSEQWHRKQARRRFFY